VNGDLPSLSKLVYMRHRRFLPHKYMYHQWRSRVGGTIENGEAPKYHDDKFVFKIIKNINVVFSKPAKGIKRKKSKKPSKDSPFKKSRFSSDTYPIGKSSRLVMSSIPCMLRRVSSKVPSVYCLTSHVRQMVDLVPVRTFNLLK
jgi:hypothetical protein